MVQPSEREKCAGPRRDGVLGVAGASKDGGALDWSRRSDEPGAGAATEGTPLLRSVPPIQPGGGSESNRRNVSLAGIVAAAARSSARARLGFFVAAVAVGALAVAAFLSPDGVMTPINGALDVVSMTQGSGSWLWGSSRRRDHHHHHRRHHDSKSASVSACERIRHALLEIEEERHEHYEERDHHARDHHYDSERHGRDKKKEEEEVKPKFHGRILFSDSRKDARKFDASVKVWNERYNSQKGRALNPPCASVIPCSEQDDTDMVVPLLVQHGANIVIKSGGHCYADYSSASSSSGVEPSPSSETSPKVLLDLSQLNSLDFDFDDSDHPDTVLAILGPGTTMGQILQNQEGLHDALMDTRAHSNHHDRNHVRLAEYYYAGVLGSGSQVAAGGYILGGGYGYWSRRHGLAIDNVRYGRDDRSVL